jgi:GNAT superfamily N-acetyltransferase
MTLSDGLHDVPPGKLAAVVTLLEMTAPAPLRGTPLPRGLTFAPMPRELERYRAAIRRVGRDWLWFDRLRLDDAQLGAVLGDADVEISTLTRCDGPEAILELDFRVPGECELRYFGLAPELIGTGAGGYLMDRAIERAWKRPIRRFHVHTCTFDSPRALDFYIRSGFTPYARQVEIADDPRRTGLHPPDAAPQIPLI